MHREDVKAQIRKAFATVGAFEIANNLKDGSVYDVLRGRSSAPTEQAIAALVHVPLHELFPHRYQAPKKGGKSYASAHSRSDNPDDSTQRRTRHRQTGRGC